MPFPFGYTTNAKALNRVWRFLYINGMKLKTAFINNNESVEKFRK